VLIVGAGPAGLACALHLANLIKKHNAAGGKPELSPDNIYVLEKGRRGWSASAFGRDHESEGAGGAGAGIREICSALDTPVTDDAGAAFHARLVLPVSHYAPPPFKNKGNYVVSLSKVDKVARRAGGSRWRQCVSRNSAARNLFTTATASLASSTEDKGLDKTASRKPNYTPGYELRAKITGWPKARAAR